MAGRHVVIVGGGFGGLQAAARLGRAGIEVTLVDRRNFHLFQPLLYQVATGGLSPADICSPLRSVLERYPSVRVLEAEATGLDLAARRVVTDAGEFVYDALIVAAGASHAYFGHSEWERLAPGLKTIEDATAMRGRILEAFERAEIEPDPGQRAAWTSFVIVGGGPTGVELAGAIGELARHTLAGEFRTIDPTRARVLLAEGTDRVLPSYPPRLSHAAERSLAKLGVEVKTGTRVTEIDPRGVLLECAGTRERVEARTVLWAAGVEASPLGGFLARSGGVELDRAGRVKVAADCSVPGHPEVFVIGDLACFEHQGPAALPGVAQVAIQQGRYVARRIVERPGPGAGEPFRYRDLGSLAVIGRAAAVADLNGLRMQGYPAWLLWIFVHIMMLIGFENRVLVFIQWAFAYFTRRRGARLITHGAGRRPT